jgi:ribosomal RNA assembly protein
MIEEKTGTKICVHGKTISIIGKWENLQVARKAIEMLLEGKMHSSVQRFLERSFVA